MHILCVKGEFYSQYDSFYMRFILSMLLLISVA